MEKQNKNLLLTFIELATEQGALKDGIAEHKKKIFNLLNEMEENYTGMKNIILAIMIRLKELVKQ